MPHLIYFRCKTSTTHLWRPHSKSKGKDRSNPVLEALSVGLGPNLNVQPSRKQKLRRMKKVGQVRVI